MMKKLFGFSAQEMKTKSDLDFINAFNDHNKS